MRARKKTNLIKTMFQSKQNCCLHNSTYSIKSADLDRHFPRSFHTATYNSHFSRCISTHFNSFTMFKKKKTFFLATLRAFSRLIINVALLLFYFLFDANHAYFNVLTKHSFYLLTLSMKWMKMKSTNRIAREMKLKKSSEWKLSE